MGIVFGKIGVECAAHDVLRQLGPNLQLRRYHPSVLVETPCVGINGKENGDAFRRLAKYIGVFGDPKNEGKQSIAMTAPVVNSTTGEKIAMTAPVINATSAQGSKEGEQVAMTAPVVNTPGTMAFVLPSKYKSVEESPKPLDPLVTLRQLPERDAAVLTFGGYASAAVVEKRARELADALNKEGIAPIHPPVCENHLPKYEVLRFNPPFTISFLRTNEILMEISRQ